MMNETTIPWLRIRRIVIIVIIAIPVALFISRWYPESEQPNSILWTWWFSLLGTAVLIFLFGWGVTGRLSGAWINSKNQYSLTQVQLVTWTIIFFASLITAMLWNHIKSAETPLNITIPGELWALLGISVGTTAGSALILNGKTNGSANQNEFLNNVYRARQQGVNIGVSENTLQALQADDNLKHLLSDPQVRKELHVDDPDAIKVSLAGLAIQYEKPLIESFFGGDEAGTLHFLDIGKVQMFFFSLLVMMAYSANIITSFLEAAAPQTVGSSGIINAFPPIDDSLITLIAISHAGYLTYQGVTKTALNRDQVQSIIPSRLRPTAGAAGQGSGGPRS